MNGALSDAQNEEIKRLDKLLSSARVTLKCIAEFQSSNKLEVILKMKDMANRELDIIGR